MNRRRNAKAERVLFHYNGHGVPRPTANGEVWTCLLMRVQVLPLFKASGLCLKRVTCMYLYSMPVQVPLFKASASVQSE
jgi:hypothetical protein